tara:strand:- start:19 stop:147 length:129 start_codon:yes stop_codon:yes gene_type:complete
MGTIIDFMQLVPIEVVNGHHATDSENGDRWQKFTYNIYQRES